jgi:hypothetical protein
MRRRDYEKTGENESFEGSPEEKEREKLFEKVEGRKEVSHVTRRQSG